MGISPQEHRPATPTMKDETNKAGNRSCCGIFLSFVLLGLALHDFLVQCQLPIVIGTGG